MSTTPRDSADGILELVRRQLDMDVAFISQIDGDRRTFRAIVADVDLPVEVGDSESYEGTYCEMITSGTLQESIPDTAAHPLTRDAWHTGAFGIGSYVGVPLRRSGGELFGTVCAFSRQAHPGLQASETEVLRATADLLMRLIENEDEVEARLGTIVGSVDAALQDSTTIDIEPVWSLASSTVVGYAATPRFADGTSYHRRLDEARDLARGVELELSVLVRAIRASQAFGPDRSMSVSLSPAAICDPLFVAVVGTADPACTILDLDVRERIEDYDAINEVLLPLRRLGLRVAVDHVGAGHSEMKHLLLLEPDVIRIDAAWLRDEDGDRQMRSLVESMAAWASRTGADLVAVGADSPELLDWARDLGVTHVQGTALADH